ncbi:hypothetical protein CHELA40_15479 [Chelatococcus asaccharovorans]|nr:hypothetical protein CHELA17_60136 [Chelatococcus asaccharovorans]CAH1682638.1 hypothetical protein CHELA40_15479 [Chelatococcus asaccharovorans]
MTAWFGSRRGPKLNVGRLVVLRRHLHPSDTGLGANVGAKRTTSKLMVLVELLNVTFDLEPHVRRDSHVKFAPQGRPGGSGLAFRLEQDVVEGLPGALARPHDELERLIIAFARLGRRAQQHLALAVVGLRATGEQQRMAEHDHVLARPEIEMPDPELLVDECHELQDFRLQPIRHLEVEGTADMDGFHVLDPGEGDVIVGPAAGHRDRHLVVLGAIEGPVVIRRKPFDNVEGMLRAINFKLDVRHAEPSACAELSGCEPAPDAQATSGKHEHVRRHPAWIGRIEFRFIHRGVLIGVAPIDKWEPRMSESLV